MDWLSQLSSGGHAAYVAVAFAVTAVLLAAELVLLRRRFKAAGSDRT